MPQLHRVLAAEELESRHYPQRCGSGGQQPAAAEARQALGVVVEVGIPESPDLVAAYADGSARYYNFSGAGVVWERPDDSLAAPIQALLAAGQRVAAQIGPWEEARPAAPPTGSVRINMLMPSGRRLPGPCGRTRWLARCWRRWR